MNLSFIDLQVHQAQINILAAFSLSAVNSYHIVTKLERFQCCTRNRDIFVLVGVAFESIHLLAIDKNRSILIIMNMIV